MDNYYVAPSDQIFRDIKYCSMAIWNTYDDTHGYASEKIDRVLAMKNVSDNAWTIVAMFDWENQAKLFKMVQPKTLEAFNKAVKKGS